MAAIIVTLNRKHFYAILMVLWFYVAAIPAMLLGFGTAMLLQRMGLMSHRVRDVDPVWAISLVLGSLTGLALYLYATWRMRRTVIFLVRAVLCLLGALALSLCWLVRRHVLVSIAVLALLAFGTLADLGHHGYSARWVGEGMAYREYGCPRWLQEVCALDAEGKETWPPCWRFHVHLMAANVFLAVVAGAGAWALLALVARSLLRRLKIDDIKASLYPVLAKAEFVRRDELATPP